MEKTSQERHPVGDRREEESRGDEMTMQSLQDVQTYPCPGRETAGKTVRPECSLRVRE